MSRLVGVFFAGPSRVPGLFAGQADQRREGHFPDAHLFPEARANAGDAHQGPVRGVRARQ